MLYFLLIFFLPLAISNKVLCPDGSKCHGDKLCCAVARNKYECCEVWSFLLKEIHVAGREHHLGIPADFAQNMSHSRHSCKKRNCRGICCNKFCCRHRHAECCAASHRCCKTGYKCCGHGHWCCKWNQECSAAHGYCISSVVTNGVNFNMMFLSIFIILFKYFFLG